MPRTETTALRDDELFIERVFQAPVELVWKLWEDKAHMIRWWGPEGFTATDLEADFRPGGKWRIGMTSRQYPKSWSHGEFRAIEKNRRIVFSFAWDEGSGEPTETLVTVELTPEGTGTRAELPSDTVLVGGIARQPCAGLELAVQQAAGLRRSGGIAMNKIISTHWISLDGYISGPAGELDFVRGDGQLAEYEIGLVGSVDHLLFGRKTYEQLSGYWSQVPTSPQAADWEKVYAGKMNPLPKSVLSRGLQSAKWENSQILRDPAAVADLKAGAGGDILIYGSASVVQELTRRSLIDEYHLLVHPVLLGGGTPLFGATGTRLNLERVSSKPFDSGIVLDIYRPSRG